MAVPHDQAAAQADHQRDGSSAHSLSSAVKGPGFVMSSRRLWLLSVKLHRSGHRFLARWVKNFNSMLYHNSLPPQVQVSPDIRLGHQGFGTILHPNVVIGRGVKIFHNVTIFVRPPTGSNRVIIEDGVIVGANAVILTPRGQDLTIGEGARIGAGAVVSRDVPARMIAISAPVELRPRASGRGPLDEPTQASGEEEDDDY
jgi:serine O-acetyltransferase